MKVFGIARENFSVTAMPLPASAIQRWRDRYRLHARTRVTFDFLEGGICFK